MSVPAKLMFLMLLFSKQKFQTNPPFSLWEIGFKLLSLLLPIGHQYLPKDIGHPLQKMKDTVKYLK